MLIALKLYMCLDHGQKMFISFWHNPKKKKNSLFSQMNLVIFAAKMKRHLVQCVCISYYSFTLIPLKLYRCLDHGLKMWVLFGYNPQIIFVTFFHIMNVDIFWPK